MGKQILVLSASLRKNSNSDALADAFIRGAEEAGHFVEKITLDGKEIQFCRGCLACQSKKDGHCIMKDDADMIVQKMAQAEVIVFATPIYFYEMCGQMKTLLDRTNPLFPIDYAFRRIYLLAAAADEDAAAIDGAVAGLKGWISCFEQCSFGGIVRGTGAEDAGSIARVHLEQAHQMGQNV